jgi:hypothetical protein
MATHGSRGQQVLGPAQMGSPSRPAAGPTRVGSPGRPAAEPVRVGGPDRRAPGIARTERLGYHPGSPHRYQGGRGSLSRDARRDVRIDETWRGYRRRWPWLHRRWSWLYQGMPQDGLASSPMVTWAQGCLAQLLGPGVPQDGIMGPGTQQAIQQFQMQQQLPVTGMLDDDTVRALQAACSGL